ncbi:MAG: C4-type zinc ribbon domain-containing protein [Candidatus Eisenbacteria bacterium]|nr:C4-type zinc ribbon domain-containing protein [Candidatus Eisenbacteria bacterium]
MTIDVRLLWDLQTKTTDALAIEEDLTRMPQRLSQARGDQAIRENEQKAIEAEKQALVLKRRGLEKEIEVFEQKIRENLNRQGQAKTNAELEAFKKEGVYLRDQRSALETQVLGMFDTEAGFDSRITEAKERVAKARGVSDQRARELGEKEAGLKAEWDEVRAACAAMAARLPPNVASRFDQLARAKAGVAVVTVQRGACGGCFNSLPPQFVNEVRKSDKINVCESCGRIIISLDPPTAGE